MGDTDDFPFGDWTFDGHNDTQPDISLGHISDDAVAGPYTVPLISPVTGQWEDDAWPDPPTTDEPIGDDHPKHRRPSAVPRWTIPALAIGMLGVAWSFWAIGNSSAAERHSSARTVVVSAEPSVSPGPTVTRTVRPSSGVTKRVTSRATITVKVTVTRTVRVRAPGSPGPTVTKTVPCNWSNCP